MSDSSSVKTIGLVTVLITLALSIGALVITAIDFRIIDINWNNSPWRHLGILQYISSIYAVGVSLIGLLIFIVFSGEKTLIAFYIGLLVLSSLFSIAIGIFNAIGGVIYHKTHHLIGCNTELTGILQLWKNIDEYMILAHSVLCSPLCHCYASNSLKQQMEINFFTKETFSHLSNYITFTDDEQAFNINNCKNGIETIREIYQSNPNNTNSHIRIKNFKRFREYWKRIENRLKCTGWCTTKYTNPFTLQNDTMIKYVFSDINKGIVKYPGCLNRIVNWIPSLVAVVGALLITCGVIQIVTLVFSLKIMSETQKE